MTSLYEKLQRRSVFRVAAAYLALAWLILQVIDTVSGILDVPSWFGRFTLIALAIGFPIAVFLAWAYELTPEGVRTADEAGDNLPATRFGGRKIDFVIIGALLLVIALLLASDRLIPDQTRSDEIPLVSNYTQLTRTQFILPPTPSPYPIVADASRLYFNDFGSGNLGVLQLSRSGGEAIPFATDAAGPDLLFNPLTMTPDGSELVLNGFNPERFEAPQLWSFPTIGGSPRLLGAGADLQFSSDGELSVFEDKTATIFIANADLSEPSELADGSPLTHWIRFSPDGERVRFTRMGRSRSIWEVSTADGKSRPLFSEWRNIDHCCGNWTPDGSFYVFQATHDHRTQLWAIAENAGTASEPVQITHSALDFRRPTIVDNGKRIYAISWQLRGELVRYEKESGRFNSHPAFNSLSVERLAYSSDGSVVSYVRFPEGDLWRCESDGSGHKQLTFSPLKSYESTWSPNGEWLAITANLPDQPPQIHLLPSSGGQAVPISSEVGVEFSPSWTPDSGSIVFTRRGEPQLQVYELASGNVSSMPGTDGLWNGLMSPDGRTIVAESREGLVIHDVASGTQETIANRGEHPYEHFYWDSNSTHLYVVDPFWKAADRTVWHIDTRTKDRVPISRHTDVITAFGVAGMWVGVDPDGAPITLRDLSIHHIYELDWLP